MSLLEPLETYLITAIMKDTDEIVNLPKVDFGVQLGMAHLMNETLESKV